MELCPSLRLVAVREATNGRRVKPLEEELEPGAAPRVFEDFCQNSGGFTKGGEGCLLPTTAPARRRPRSGLMTLIERWLTR